VNSNHYLGHLGAALARLLESVPVRLPVITFLWATLGAVCARGEVIHLKNGRTIWADHVHEKGTRIEYDIGDNSYAIPKSSVERVEAGGLPPAYASSSGAKPVQDLPAFTPGDSLQGEGDLVTKIIHDGHVDRDALAAIEQRGNSALAATADFIAGKHEFERGDLGQARRYYEAALRFQGNNSTILTYYSALLLRTGNAQEALIYAERAVRAAPDSPDPLAVLGYAQFVTNRTHDAIGTWKKCLHLRPDATIERMIARAEREQAAETEFSERETSHFTLRYEGKQSSEALRREVLAVLESDYNDLVRDLGISPRSSIPVVLYSEQAFFDVTRAPAWTGAINDGKLRIPISGVSSVTPELARVLKHELAHSFINQISGNRCPHWLNEGIAQLLEPATVDSYGNRLARLFRVQQEIPLNNLEGSFTRFSGTEASLAYGESLAAVQYISETYSLSDLQRILQRIGQGSSTEAAVRATIHSDYGQLEAEVAKFLVGKYGGE
jgi:tetratricopeptide (TPR) repeat protein